MERFILKKLLSWKNSLYRKLLILKGVCQVGKTWILKKTVIQWSKDFAYIFFRKLENLILDVVKANKTSHNSRHICREGEL